MKLPSRALDALFMPDSVTLARVDAAPLGKPLISERSMASRSTGGRDSIMGAREATSSSDSLADPGAARRVEGRRQLMLLAQGLAGRSGCSASPAPGVRARHVLAL